MDYIIIGLLAFNLLLLLLILIRKNRSIETELSTQFKAYAELDAKRELALIERLVRMENVYKEELTNFNLLLKDNMHNDFNKLNDRMDHNFRLINEQINQKLELGFEKNNKTTINMVERMGTIELNIARNLTEFNTNLKTSLNNDFEKLNDRIEQRLLMINEKVNERLEQGFEKTNLTFSNILERLSKIDEAQKKIDSLSTEIVSLQDVLIDKKARGTFGEVQLHHILATIFGEGNHAIYQEQFKFSNNNISDAVLFAPEPLGVIAIDSKFPLDNYRRMIDKTLSEIERNNAVREFNKDMKKHIDDISNKYIIKHETSDQAFLFLPAEAIFAEINAYHQDILEYAYKKRVWITSPTTLMSTLTTVQAIIINMERNKYASIIHEELGKLELEFNRYKERWDKLSQHIDTVSKDVKDIHTTTEKIGKRFEAINSVDRNLITDNE